MNLTSFQNPELRDSNNNIVQNGAYGKNTAFCNAQNTGILDYINNNLQVLFNGFNETGITFDSSGKPTLGGPIKTQLDGYVGQVSTAKTNAVNEVNSAKNSALSAMTTEKNNHISAIQNKGTETLNSIPANYTTFYNAFEALGLSVQNGVVCQTFNV